MSRRKLHQHQPHVTISAVNISYQPSAPTPVIVASLLEMGLLMEMGLLVTTWMAPSLLPELSAAAAAATASTGTADVDGFIYVAVSCKALALLANARVLISLAVARFCARVTRGLTAGNVLGAGVAAGI